MVSTTASTSRPAVNPGPRPTVMGAIPRWVPRFFLAKMASTTAMGRSAAMLSPLSSTTSGSLPLRKKATACCKVSAFQQVRPSTVWQPVNTASLKATVRRMAVGRAHSSTSTGNPQLCRRLMVPVAKSPPPRTMIRCFSIGNTPDFIVFPLRFFPA